MFNVLRDTREKPGWQFTISKYIDEVIDFKLDTGDYTIQGMEDLICIERKASTSEISINIFEKRFKDELDRMMTFKYRYIIMEFPFEYIMKFPISSGIPPKQFKKLKVHTKIIIKALTEIQVKYNIPIIYAGSPDNGAIIAESLMRHVYELEKK